MGSERLYRKVDGGLLGDYELEWPTCDELIQPLESPAQSAHASQGWGCTPALPATISPANAFPHLSLLTSSLSFTPSGNRQQLTIHFEGCVHANLTSLWSAGHVSSYVCMLEAVRYTISYQSTPFYPWSKPQQV